MGVAMKHTVIGSDKASLLNIIQYDMLFKIRLVFTLYIAVHSLWFSVLQCRKIRRQEL